MAQESKIALCMNPEQARNKMIFVGLDCFLYFIK